MQTWALVFHFYQPPTQDLALTHQIIDTTYLPLLRLFLDNPNAKVTLNISSTLSTQVEMLGRLDFFDAVKRLVEREQVELLNSPFYHPLMPFTPTEVIDRQLKYSKKTIEYLYHYSPTGLYPPELAVDTNIVKYLQNSDYTHVIIDESSAFGKINAEQVVEKSFLKTEKLALGVSSRVVTSLLRAYPTDIPSDSFLTFIAKQFNTNPLLISAHDAELFGHHYAERLNTLQDVLSVKTISFVTLKEALERFPFEPTEPQSITASTWQTSNQDLKENQPYPQWVKTDFQKKYLALMKNAYKALTKRPKPNPDHGLVYSSAEKHYDRGISSCHLYWLSNDPWWHPELVELGAQNLIKAIRTLPGHDHEKKKYEKEYYDLMEKIWCYNWDGKQNEGYAKHDVKRNIMIQKLTKLL